MFSPLPPCSSILTAVTPPSPALPSPAASQQAGMLARRGVWGNIPTCPLIARLSL